MSTLTNKIVAIHESKRGDGTRKQGRRLFCFGMAILIIAFIFTEINIYKTVDYSLNSDDASELILAELLAKENRIITDDWYYSTEIRFINTQLVYTPLFLIFDNWHLIRCVGNAILHCILLLSAYLLCKKLNCVRYFPAAGLMLILPFSGSYYSFVLRVPYYIPHIVISFLSVTLSLMYIPQSKKRNSVVLLVSFALAVMSGMGGARQVVVCYLPMMVCALALLKMYNSRDYRPQSEKYYWFFAFALVCFIGSIIGYFINIKILSRHYYFRIFSLNYNDFNLNRLFEVLAGFLRVMGYQTGPINLKNTICNVACAFYLISLLYCMVNGLSRKNVSSFEYRMLSMYALCSILVYTLLYSFTDMGYADRYGLPIMVFTAPLMACHVDCLQIQEADSIIEKKLSRINVVKGMLTKSGGGYCHLSSHWFGLL